MLRFFALIFLLTATSCFSNQKKKDNNIEIAIKVGQSYTYDLKRQIFTVSNLLKPDTTVEFNLTATDKQRIIDKYYDLDLDELKEEVRIDDKCMIMPKIYTTVKIRSNGKEQVFIVDETCKDYTSKSAKNGKRISKFLSLVFSVLNSKPELKNTPVSDIWYI